MSAKIFLKFCTAVGTVFIFALAHAASIEDKVDMLGTPKYLQIVSLNSGTKNQLLVVNAEIVNTDDRDNNAYYRVRWLDQDGDQVWDDQAWKPVLLHGNQKIRLRAVAPTTKAKDFKIEFSAEDNRRK